MNAAIACQVLAIATAMALLPPLAVAQGRPLWRTVDMSRQLRDSLPQRVRVQYGAGRVELRRTTAPLLYSMRLRYDEGRGTPLHHYDAEQRTVLLGMTSTGGVHTASGGDRDQTGELVIALPDRVPLDLDLRLGGTKAQFELGGLALRSLRIECGATEAILRFSEPNRERLRDLDIDMGAADFTAVNLGNSGAEQIRLHGGVGVVDLDFGGQWTRDMTVTTRLALGKLTLRVPSEVGVRLEVQRVAAGFDHEGFVKRGDAWYSANYDRAPHKLQLRAETFFGKIEIRRDGL